MSSQTMLREAVQDSCPELSPEPPDNGGNRRSMGNDADQAEDSDSFMGDLVIDESGGEAERIAESGSSVRNAEESLEGMGAEASENRSQRSHDRSIGSPTIETGSSSVRRSGRKSSVVNENAGTASEKVMSILSNEFSLVMFQFCWISSIDELATLTRDNHISMAVVTIE